MASRISPRLEKLLLWVLVPSAIAGIAVIVVLSFVGNHQTTTAIDQKNETQAQNQGLQSQVDLGKDLATKVQAACAVGGQTAKDLGQACEQATIVQQAPVPGPSGQQGQPGTAGRGITGTAIVANHLMISYTDGKTEDKGVVVGAVGVKGTDGRGIKSTSISGGHLVLAYTDGTSEDVGQVVGKNGENGNNGENGANGRGIASIAISGDFHLVVTYTDGTSDDLGQLPPGPQGQQGQQGNPGVSVVRQYFDRDDSGSCRNYNDFSDGRTRVDQGPAGDAACPAPSVPTSSTEVTPTS